MADLRSDVIETTKMPKLQKSLVDLDKYGEMPYGTPVPDQNGFVILFTQKYFGKQVEIRKAIAIHELGHFYVHATGMLKNLRLKWSTGEEMFEVFVSVVKQDQSWYENAKHWLKRLYELYVFDILKIPGEIFANMWVRDNFPDAFSLVAEEQLKNYEYLANTLDKEIKTRIVKFPLFSIILRLEGLLMLMNGERSDLKDKLWQSLSFSSKKMSGFILPNEVKIFDRTRQDVVQVCSSPKTADKHLFDVFEKFVTRTILQPADFV